MIHVSELVRVHKVGGPKQRKMKSSTALSLLALFSSTSSLVAMAQVLTREDGKCGLVDGVEAGCEHIPPFPTCCQDNGH